MTEPSTYARMKAVRRWLLASPQKIPHYSDGAKRRGTLDTPQDVARLTTYDQAKAAVEASGPGWHLGFALGRDEEGEHWQGVDLDAIEDNLLMGLADALPGYVEASPSGKGVHAIGYGRHTRSLGSNGSGIEAYAARRFFTVTENVIRDGGIVCLADHIEKELARHHKLSRAKAPSYDMPSTNEVGGIIQVSPQTVVDLRSALNHMRSDDYDLWIEIGHALKVLGDVGRGLWLDWSETSSRFEKVEAAGKWESFAPTQTGYQAVFAKSQDRGWVNPASNAAQSGSSRRQDVQSDTNRSLVFQPLADVQMRAIDWLWTGWIPKGYITLLAGETGAGKSTILADIAARVSRGVAWPGEQVEVWRTPGRVLWLGSEDGTEEMTVPRLKACGADLSKILEIRGVESGGRRSTFSMQDDLQLVADWLKLSRDEGAPFAMLVIDPVTSYLPGRQLRKVDLNDAGQLRSILEPWLRLAQEFNIAIVCVTHFAKDTARSMLHRVLGSAVFAQTCRSLCAVIERPAMDGQDAHGKALVQVKVNLPEHPGGSWRFKTVKVEVGTDPRTHAPIYATHPEWEMLDTVFTPQMAVGNARGPVSRLVPQFGDWLTEQFSASPDEWRPVNEVKLSAINRLGISESWWTKHSSQFLDKKNEDGKWLCRPRLLNDKTQHGGESGGW